MPAYGKHAMAALAARAAVNQTSGFLATASDSLSPLGTANFTGLPQFLTNNPLPQGYPWGTRTAKATDAYNNVPNTGVTRHYDFVVSEIDCAPDGYPNKCLVVNGQFPGPIIEANWGDMIEVKVTNSLETEGTALHWHGILQKKSPWMDGVPGVDQCPIAPGASFTYFFQVDLYGTTWYHSHYSGQFGSGLWGPLVVYGPQNLPYDEDLGPVAISDYYHAYYQTIEEQILAPPEEVRPPLANNNLINGKASSGGPGIASFYVQSGKSYRIRLINPSAVSVQKFSIDGYSFMIFANDLVPVEPYESNLVTIGVSQRTDIVFKATGKPTDAVWMRGYRPPPCGPSAGNEEVLAAIFYEDADTSKLPTTSANANAYDQSCMNDPLTDTVPYHPLAAPTPGKTENIVLNYQSNGSALVWYLNEQTFRIDLNDPILLETKLGNAADLPPIRNAHIYGNNISSVVVVIENPGFQPHPMHMHGHNIMILDTGECSYIPGPGGISPADQSQLPAAATSAQPPPATFVPNFSAFDQHSDGNGPAFHQSHQTESFSNQQLGQSNGHYGPETSPATTGNFAATTTNFNAGTGRSGYPGTEVFSSQGPAATESATSYIKQGKSSYAGSGKHGKRAVPPPDSCWDGTIVNPQNPQRRDVQMLVPGSYIVIQWIQDNPGVWPLHCHIAWHLSAGLAYMVVEQPEGIMQDMQIPSIMAETCRGWAAYTGDHIVDVIDSGL